MGVERYPPAGSLARSVEAAAWRRRDAAAHRRRARSRPGRRPGEQDDPMSKQDTISEHRTHETDTGSPEVQIALLSPHQPLDRAPARAPQGPPQPAWPAHARRPPAPDARLRSLDRRQPLPRDRLQARSAALSRPAPAPASTTAGLASPAPNASYTASSVPARRSSPTARFRPGAPSTRPLAIRAAVVCPPTSRQHPHGLDDGEQVDFVRWPGLGERERTDRSPSEAAQVGAATEEPAEVGGEGT